MLNKHITVIAKLTNACNMRCSYCFIEPHVFHKNMTVSTARRIVRAFLDSDHFTSVEFVWHGGEPLLRKRAFYEKIFNEQKSKPTNVAFTNSLQTNATRLDRATLSFLLSHRVQIGFSLDGPQAINDHCRKVRHHQHESAYQYTIDAASRLQSVGQRPGAIVVVNKITVEHPETIYAEFKCQGINMRVLPLTESGLARTESAQLAITAEQYGHFLTRLFDVWYTDDDQSIVIEPFRQHIARILGVNTAHSCHFTKHCHHGFVGIAPDGDLFPCGMFQGEEKFRYGNIHDMDPLDISFTQLFKKIEKRESQLLQHCSKCSFYDLCYGGCMFHSLKNSLLFAIKDYYCPGYKVYFEHLLRLLHSDLSKFQNEN